MIFITGDTHGKFDRIAKFCKTAQTSKDDILIILGDAGINYYADAKDRKLKKYLQSLPITIFAIHGNHEIRPQNIPSYREIEWHGGIVYREEMYPDLLFAKDGEIYDLDSIKTIVIGGAYSVDKEYRIANHWGWWADEQPDDAVKGRVEKALADNGNKIDVILSHTTPYKYMPTEMFLKSIDQSKVDKSTELWLGEIESRVAYRKWYCGHYHTDKKIDKLQILFNLIQEFDCL